MLGILLLLQVAVVAGCLSLIGYFLVNFYRPAIAATVPRVRDEGKSRFSLRTRLAYYTDCRALYQEAWDKYAKHGKTCVVPFLGLSESVILPSSSLSWFARQKDDVLSATEAFAHTDKAHYTTSYVKAITVPWQGWLIKTQLTKVLDSLASALEDEISVSSSKRFGTDSTRWVEHNALDTIRHTIGQASSRFTVGVPLCRDEDYLRDQAQWGELFVRNAGILALIPPYLQKVVSKLLCIELRTIEKRTEKKFKPLFEERLRLLKEKSSEQPLDHLQMMLQHAEEFYPHELNLFHINIRLVLSNFGAFHQTSYLCTNLVLDVIDSDSKYNTIQQLREEITSVLKQHNGQWSRAAGNKMVKLDSVLRETMRLHSWTARNMLRLVVDDAGIETEDGHLIPKGTIVAVLQHAPSTDPDQMDSPLEYDPFRWSRPREAAMAKGEDDVLTGNFTAISSTYMGFGGGKHACPGRYIVDLELKITLAHLVMNYDLKLAPEHKGVRPQGPWLAEAHMPPANARICVKYRG